MKVLTQSAAVLIAINLITANTNLAQQPRQEEVRELQASLARTSADLAKMDADLVSKAADLQSQQANMQADQAAMVLQVSRLGMASALGGQGSGVLMVLTDQMKAQDVAATTEDLNIMSRIFDKKLEPAYATYKSHARSANIDLLFTNLRQRDGSQGTQAIYLHRFAALFLMSVDFPLSAPPEVEVEKVDKDVDAVWEGAKREISTSGKTPDAGYVYVKYDSPKQYDAEKVEDLKTNLTRALKHAANIRNLKPGESIIIVVASPQGPGVTVGEVANEGGKTYRVMASTNTKTPLAPTLLTIQAKKADIDAYAKDQLNLEQFRERIQFLTSHISLGPKRANLINVRGRY